jgi:hypothetical protein
MCISVWPHRNGCRTGKELYPMLARSWWWKLSWSNEQGIEFIQKFFHDVT